MSRPNSAGRRAPARRPRRRRGARPRRARATAARRPRRRRQSRWAALMSGRVGRNLGLVVALALLCIVGRDHGRRPVRHVDNALTILRLAVVIGVVSVGMTFVIIGGGIDLSVGAILALSSVWATTLATQQMASDTHWLVMVFAALPSAPGAAWSTAW